MARWAAAGVVGQIRDQLRRRVRREMGRAPGAVATVIDSQLVKAADTVGRESRRYDAGKKINGRKRHLIVDAKGLPLFVMVTPADMTDRNAAKEVLFRRWCGCARPGRRSRAVHARLLMAARVVGRLPGSVVVHLAGALSGGAGAERLVAQVFVASHLGP